MKHPIDPKVDCVFKALLGTEENKDLLTHFINATLASELQKPVTEVTLQDPHNSRESLSDKLSIVDAKAKDSEGKIFQIEIQILQYAHSLPVSHTDGPTSIANNSKAASITML